MTHTPIALGKSVVYFPSIEFRDVGWLKAALCIYERVYRIVPPGYTPSDSGDVRALEDAGVLGRIDLKAADLEEARISFESVMQHAECRPAALTDGTEEIRFLHKGKVGERLHHFFQQHGKPLDTGEDDWFEAQASLVHAYMMHLAEVTAKRRGMAKVTDDKDTFAVSPFVDGEGNIADYGYDPNSGGSYLALNMTTVIPEGIRKIGMKELLAFRKANTEGRTAFARLVDQTVSCLANIADPDTAGDMVAQLRERLDGSLAEIRKMHTYDGKELAVACVSVGIPAYIGTMSLFVPTPFTPLAIGTAATVALVASMATAYGVKRAQPVDPARSYYVALGRTASQVTRSRYPSRENDFWAVMEEYLND